MRDHLLGCQAFLPPEPDPQDRTTHLRKHYPVGIPEREYRAYEDQMVKAIEAKQEITGFEKFDHTPPEMRDAFPREYDLQTMLNEAAGRMNFAAFEKAMSTYDTEMQRLCGVDWAKPGADTVSVLDLADGIDDYPLSYFALKSRR